MPSIINCMDPNILKKGINIKVIFLYACRTSLYERSRCEIRLQQNRVYIASTANSSTLITSKVIHTKIHFSCGKNVWQNLNHCALNCEERGENCKHSVIHRAQPNTHALYSILNERKNSVVKNSKNLCKKVKAFLIF